jgi:hypothetical protein
MAAIGLILVMICGYVEALPNPYQNTIVTPKPRYDALAWSFAKTQDELFS